MAPAASPNHQNRGISAASRSDPNPGMIRWTWTAFSIVLLSDRNTTFRRCASAPKTIPCGHSTGSGSRGVDRLPPLSGGGQQLIVYLSNAPADTSVTELVRVAGLRWPIETTTEEGNDSLGGALVRTVAERVGPNGSVVGVDPLASCDEATSSDMPGPDTLFRPEAERSRQDVETICAAARQQ